MDREQEEKEEVGLEMNFEQYGVINMREEFSRSGGKGGQNVNKRDTKVKIVGRVVDAVLLARLRELYPGSVTQSGEFSVESQEERSQGQNRDKARKRFEERIQEALKVPVERIPTAPTRGAKERRIEEKKKLGKKKEQRRGGWE